MAERSTLPPIRPAQLRALIPTGQDDLCAILKKYFQWQLLIYRWNNYAFPDGSFSDALKAEICFAVSFCGDPQDTNADSPFYEPPTDQRIPI